MAFSIFSPCSFTDALEKEGEGRENQICNMVDRKPFEDYASFSDPDIAIEALSYLPERAKMRFTPNTNLTWELRGSDI